MNVTDRILTTLTAVSRMNYMVEEMEGLMKEQQRLLDDLSDQVNCLETVLELVFNRSSAPVAQLSDADGSQSAR